MFLCPRPKLSLCEVSCLAFQESCFSISIFFEESCISFVLHIWDMSHFHVKIKKIKDTALEMKNDSSTNVDIFYYAHGDGLGRLFFISRVLSFVSFEMKWHEMKWHEMKWHEMKWNEMKWNEMKWNKMKWNEMKWNEMKWNVMKWNEMKWNVMKWDEM